MNRWRQEFTLNKNDSGSLARVCRAGGFFFLASTAVGGKFYFSDGRFD